MARRGLSLKIQGGPSGRGQPFVDFEIRCTGWPVTLIPLFCCNQFGESPGLWAATAASYFPSRPAARGSSKLIATEYRTQGDGLPCILVVKFNPSIQRAGAGCDQFCREGGSTGLPGRINHLLMAAGMNVDLHYLLDGDDAVVHCFLFLSPFMWNTRRSRSFISDTAAALKVLSHHLKRAVSCEITFL